METIKKVIKITPIASELLSKVMLKCLDKTCESTFQNYGNLCLHMSKHHKIIINNKDDINVIKQYYCPEINCKYNREKLNSYTTNNNNIAQFFTNIRLLKQHYIKVHAEKSINCEICNKSFYNVTAKRNHKKLCGIIFKCKDCNWKYNTPEALHTHCKRKGHAKDIGKNINKLQIKKQEKQRLTEIINKKTKYIKIVPNFTESNNNNITMPQQFPARTIINDGNKILNNKKGTSKKVKTKTKITQTNLKSTQLNNSLDLKNISADIVSKCNNSTLQRVAEKMPSSNSMTVSSNSFINPTNTSYVNNYHINKRKPLENFDIFDSESNSNNNLTKNLNNLNYMEDDSINNYFRFNSDTFTTGLCHIETQTDIDPFFNDASNQLVVDQMLYSHMHTQTCDEILSELGFSDIQTQTNWSTDTIPTGADEYNDLFVSTETQTNFSCASIEKYMASSIINCNDDDDNRNNINCNGMSIQTQTANSYFTKAFADYGNNNNNNNYHSTYTQTN